MRRPNILLVTVDCLRADVLDAYGGPIMTPTINALAASGARFEAAFAHSSFTKTTFPSLFGGTYPGDCGGPARFSVDRPCLAEALADLGYTTIGVNSNPWLTPHFGFDRGFSSYLDLSRDRPLAHRFPVRLLHFGLSLLGGGLVFPVYPSGERLTAVALDAIRVAPAPWFLWLHYMDAHWPYDMARPLLFGPWHRRHRAYSSRLARRARRRPGRVRPPERAGLFGLYVAGVRTIDRCLGSLMEALDDETAVLLTADHGEAFGEHGRFFHMPNLHAENLRVPLLFRAPGVAPGTVETAIVRHIDVAPTLVALAGGTGLEGARGVNLLPALHGDAPLPALPAYAEIGLKPGRYVSLREGDIATLLELDADGRVVAEELYDFRADPAETSDLAPDRPALMAERRARLLAFIADLAQDAPEPSDSAFPYDPDIEARLRALGYLE